MKYLQKIKSQFQKLKKWAKKQTEFYIAFLAAAVWFAFWGASFVFGTESYPVGYFQKIAFGIMGISIISGVTFFWLRKTHPHFYNLLDPDTPGGIEKLTEWEQIKIGLFWFFLFAGGSVLLASQY